MAGRKPDASSDLAILDIKMPRMGNVVRATRSFGRRLVLLFLPPAPSARQASASSGPGPDAEGLLERGP